MSFSSCPETAKIGVCGQRIALLHSLAKLDNNASTRQAVLGLLGIPCSGDSNLVPLDLRDSARRRGEELVLGERNQRRGWVAPSRVASASKQTKAGPRPGNVFYGW